MDKAQIKEKYEHFREWQRSPNAFQIKSDDEHVCQCCGHRFVGNYCPGCSQKAEEGAIGWRSVRQSFMDIWGLGSRSLPRSICHLLLRPGYLISDYISGKRQVSFPPVKMLFFVAVIIVLLVYYLIPLLLGRPFDVMGEDLSNERLGDWIQGYFAWTYFIIALLYILPTWIMFRYAPRHTRHTLPQGFFIQVFLCVINLVLSFILLLPFALINYIAYLMISWIVLIIYYIIAYKQLFGYGIWGTLWRVLVVVGSTYSIFQSLLELFNLYGLSQEVAQKSPIVNNAINYLAYGLTLLAIGWVINLIATKLTRKEFKLTKQ